MPLPAQQRSASWALRVPHPSAIPSCPVANSPITVVIATIPLLEARREDRTRQGATRGGPGRDTRDTRARHAGAREPREGGSLRMLGLT
jgi:hypothetical protein